MNTGLYEELLEIILRTGEFIMLAVVYFLLLLIFAAMVVAIASVLKSITRNQIQRTAKALIILGSGGHTREILSLSRCLSKNYSPKVYVSTDSDKLSIEKAREIELTQTGEEGAQFISVVRIRDVGQSFLNALLVRAPTAFYQSVVIITQQKPDIILCNGPGVCVPFCIIAFVTNALRITRTRIIFVESICRVRSLSMTGKILIRLAHDFIVQWEDLRMICKAGYPNSNVLYLGRLS